MRSHEFEKILLQKVLQHIDVGIHVIDSNGKTVFYNETMAKLEGIEREKAMNRQLLEIFPSLNENTSTLLSVIKTGESIINRTQTYLNYKGQKITTVNTTIPINRDNTILGALEIAKNVTNIQKLSEQLVDLQIELIGDNKKDIPSISNHYVFDHIIGRNEEFLKAIDIARKAKDSSSSVLIFGETGSGKELFAQSIHYDGLRKSKPFIGQNCAAFPESLLESILFGTVRGSFTGAVDRPGLFEQANGGTILLDEVNSMGMSLQAKLLRVLQEGYIRRVGGLKDIPIDVRIIATTNEEPLESVSKGTIRKDLYYRLNVVSIRVPPLRERRDDIKLLCEHFIKHYNRKLNKDVWMISKDLMQEFMKHSWQGNVRELENLIEGAMNYISNDEHVLKKEHFYGFVPSIMDKEPNYDELIHSHKPLPDIILNVEKSLIQDALDQAAYNISESARLLGIKRQTLQHKIKKYRIPL
ncbi:arginine utilization regulatory protein [Proteiniborus ethanoligenes]|uniref:Arginine utilization regulatory protein n=1 Tax=Proteiniborus ethanoligenes TaxID=415015 RepID=A0A1H3JYC7_9FIRM|nr:sigma 54-interacting transcriptional regulator [Proteiniborus ethanoligenes]SDY44629.1 arginine utilization regulatory protein [Proteiniborus ethanoligenes]